MSKKKPAKTSAKKKVLIAPLSKEVVIRKIGDKYVADDLKRNKRVSEADTYSECEARVSVRGYTIV